MSKKILIIFIAVILIVGGGSFYAGMKVGGNKKLGVFGQNNLSGQRQQFIGDMKGGSQNGMSFVTGDIISKDDKSVTVKTQNGGSKVVFYTTGTEVGKFTTGNETDLEIGKSISVTGKTNQDGSVAAQSIQIRPAVQNPQNPTPSPQQ